MMLSMILGLALLGQNQTVATDAGPAEAGRAAAVQQVQAGIAAEQSGQHATAMEDFRKAIHLDPQLAAGYVDLGTIYMEQNQPAKALAPLKKALQLDPGIAGAEGMLGEALLLQGYSMQAIPHLQSAGMLGPLGIAQLDLGDLDHSISNLQAALQQHPNDSELLFYLSRAAGLLSKQAGDTLLSTHPDSARAHEALAENYWGLQRTADAEKEYMQALQLQPDLPGVHLALGEIYASTQDWAKAEKEFQAEVALQPGSAEAAYRLGDALLKTGAVQQAAAELAHANTLQPDMPETLYALGKAQALDGDSTGAEKSWDHLLQIEQTSDLSAQAHFSLAGLYRKQGKPAQAEKEMQEFERIKTAEKQ